MDEKFSLKWNDFHSNVSKSFGLFRNEDYLHDVTLVSDDYHQVSAHKLVLSACSEYFKNIFKFNSKSNSHPLLCLTGIKSDDLKNIMDYIYNGEVQIFQDNLDRFLEVAQKLQLEGLMGNGTSETHQGDKMYAKTEGVASDTQEEIEETPYVPSVKTKSRTQNNHKPRDITPADKIVVPISSTSDIDEVLKTVQQYIETDGDAKLKCTLCGKIASCPPSNPGVGRKNLEHHIETHLEGLSFPCQLCGKTFRSRHSLRLHKNRFHQ